ncbi:hypothetical protein RRF57_008199 [Xylaria bambusicola]|uniref:Uncharacterized protein n=1 Tax=Xylaria bambusicola TaxID=326684 RepID=A0AAN7UHB4_9PEZI
MLVPLLRCGWWTDRWWPGRAVELSALSDLPDPLLALLALLALATSLSRLGAAAVACQGFLLAPLGLLATWKFSGTRGTLSGTSQGPPVSSAR